MTLATNDYAKANDKYSIYIMKISLSLAHLSFSSNVDNDSHAKVSSCCLHIPMLCKCEIEWSYSSRRWNDVDFVLKVHRIQSIYLQNSKKVLKAKHFSLLIFYFFCVYIIILFTFLHKLSIFSYYGWLNDISLSATALYLSPPFKTVICLPYFCSSSSLHIISLYLYICFTMKCYDALLLKTI